jgi:outer membrane immunogenic protein
LAGLVDLPSFQFIVIRLGELWRWGLSMRRLWLALVASVYAIALTQIASAQQPLRSPVYWTGVYIGGSLGYSWGRSSSTLLFSDNTGTLTAAGPSFDLNGVIGGGQLGYNWRAGIWVFGLETDIQGSAQKGNTSASCAGGAVTPIAALNGTCTPGHIGDTRPFDGAAFPVTSTLSQSLAWFGTVRGRIGPTITPAILVYVTGGLAYGRVDSTFTVNGVNVTGPQGTNTFFLTPAGASLSDSTTKTGYTIGAGIEGVLFGNWTGKIEYLYVDLGTVSGGLVTPIVTNTGAFLTSSYSSRITDNILRVGLNYRLGGP